MQFTYTIEHPVGLYASLADGLVSVAKRYNSTCTLTYNNKTVDLKSLMGVISLGVPTFGEVTFSIEGSDQKELKQAILAYLGSNSLFFVV